ncbi:hypothetical protein D8911_06485 [Levilactobacillus brevis]|nr:hypothetical protein D8911_06485 [Levilactobacillus brevis]
MGGPVEPQCGLALALSRNARLKDASFLSAMARAAKGTPTAEPIVDELSATIGDCQANLAIPTVILFQGNM